MQKIKIETIVNASREKAWKVFTNPEDIMKWNHASDDWHSPKAVNDLRPGGTFTYRMESKDGKQGFDFGGTYDEVKPHELLAYTIGDGRKVMNEFSDVESGTKVVVIFEAENENSLELQQSGWQAILDNFKKAVEDN